MGNATRETQQGSSFLIGYKKLIAWQKADLLAHLVYDLTMHFPKEEIFGLTSQLQRAILSVVANIVEGYSRNSKKEFHHFLSIPWDLLLKLSIFSSLLSKGDIQPKTNLKR